MSSDRTRSRLCELRKLHQNLTTPSLADCVGFRDRSTQPTRVSQPSRLFCVKRSLHPTY
ncbi:hypothetical protein [Limnospira maxima]|uniref:hypothetical protein n=1 Tax=Limnospira maxima TaxID=129910 RepID=UPI000AD402CF|nr:hypothetical protein [Limnospira maxima]